MRQDTFTCPGCNSALPSGASTCVECGEDLASLLRLKMEPQILYNQGLSLALSGDLDNAILKLRSAIAAMPDEPRTYILLGKLYALRGEFVLAQYWWEAALKRWPNELDAQQGLQVLNNHLVETTAQENREKRRQKWLRLLWFVVAFLAGSLVVVAMLVASGYFSGTRDTTPSTPIALAGMAESAPTATSMPPSTVAPSMTHIPRSATPTLTQIHQPTPTVTSTSLPSPTPDLVSAVKMVIKNDPLLAELEINITQQGSAIILHGDVPGVALKYDLEALVKEVPGVTLVDVSNLRVVYRIKSGDTLSGISLKMYGQASLWHSITNENHLTNPNRIYPGDTLLIPPPR